VSNIKGSDINKNKTHPGRTDFQHFVIATQPAHETWQLYQANQPGMRQFDSLQTLIA
jgi:hypothetical protein